MDGLLRLLLGPKTGQNHCHGIRRQDDDEQYMRVLAAAMAMLSVLATPSPNGGALNADRRSTRVAPKSEFLCDTW